MPFNFTVSPDFAPDHLSGWFIFNTWLQRQLETDIHLELYDTFDEQRKDLREGKIDLIYANPYDASMLVRELGFTAVACPEKRRDEAVVVVPADSPYTCVEDLKPGVRVASTDDPDVNMIGMIMLEPADLDKETVLKRECPSYIMVAKSLLKGECDAGFFLKQAYDELSGLTRSRLKVLVNSEISVVHHTLLVGPELKDRFESLQYSLVNMSADPKGTSVLESMGLNAWKPMTEEETEFMIDLIDTLLYEE